MKKHAWFLFGSLIFSASFFNQAQALSLLSIEGTKVNSGKSGQGEKIISYEDNLDGTETKEEIAIEPGIPSGYSLRAMVLFYGAEISKHEIIDKIKINDTGITSDKKNLNEIQSEITSISIIFSLIMPTVYLIDFSLGFGGAVREYRSSDNLFLKKDVQLLTYQGTVSINIPISKWYQIRVGLGSQVFTGSKTRLQFTDSDTTSYEVIPDYKVVNLIIGFGVGIF